MNVMGFENGWIGVFIEVNYKGTPTNATGVVTICDDDLALSFAEPANPTQYKNLTATAKAKSSWFRDSAPKSTEPVLGALYKHLCRTLLISTFVL